MTRKYFHAALILIVGGVILGCAARAPKPEVPMFQPYDLNYKLQSGQFVPRVDNYMIILDASQSMSAKSKFKNYTNFTFAKEMVRRINATLPEMNIRGAFRTFGHGVCLPEAKTLLINTLDTHLKNRLEAGLEKVACDGGTSPLAPALQATAEDLREAGGNTAVIIISDGRDMDQAPVEEARKIKQEYGDRLCLSTVLIGDDPDGQILLNQLTDIGECGIAVQGEDIASSQAMAEFVERIFLVKAVDSDGDGVMDHLDKCPNTPPGVPVDESGCSLDSDNDGVHDGIDQCPGTPGGVQVDRRGCPLDSDNDGVPDYADRCPETPVGVEVDEYGCPFDSDGDGVSDYQDQCPDTPKGVSVDEVGCWECVHVRFDFDKWEITPGHMEALEGMLQCLNDSPEMKVEIQGHADSIGTMDYNLKLSEKRARAVLHYLLDSGIQKNRLKIKGYGFTRPVASNKTKEGRAKNRRVQLQPVD